MKNFLLLLALLTGICHPKGTSAQVIDLGTGGSTRAVVVGISDYQDDKIPDLRFADRDAEAFTAWLRSPAGGSLPDDNIQFLLNEKATKAQFAAALGWLLEHSSEGDQALIYFSGHGDVDNKIIGQEGFLLFWDTPSQSYISGAYPLYFLKLVISTLSLQNKAKMIMIADACRAGKLAGSAIGGAQITNENLRQQFAHEIKILSCQPNEVSIESEQWGGGRGVFSYHLMDGMYGMADGNTDGQVTLSEMNRYLEDHVTKEAAPMRQTPMVVGDKWEPLAQVQSDVLALWKKGKDGLPVQFKQVEQRGLEEETLAKVDTNIRQLYFAFKRAVQEKVFLEPADSCANAYYEKLMAVAELKPLHGAMTRNFAAALQDDAQQWVNKFLQSSLEGREWNHPKGYSLLIERAANLLGEGHYFYKNLKAEEYYFRARDLMSAKGFNVFKGTNPQSMDVELFGELIFKGLAYDENAPYLYAQLALYYNYKDDYSKAIESWQKAVDLAPSWIYANALLGVYHAIHKGNLKKGKEWLEKAYYMDTSFNPYLGWLADIYALQHNFKKHNEMANEIMERVLSYYNESDSNIGQLEDLANNYWFWGFLDKAETAFKQYINRVLETGDEKQIYDLWGAYEQLGWVLVVKGNLNESEKWFLKSDSIHENSLAKAGLFQIAHKSGQHELGDSHLADAIRVGHYSESGSILMDGLFLMGIYNWLDEVILLYTKSLEHFPTDAPLHYHLARLYLEQKNDFAKGVPLLERAVQLDSSHAYSHYHLAAAYAHLGKKEAALDYLEKALALGYDDPGGIEQDARWEGLRGTKRYGELMKRYFPEKARD